MKGEEELPCFQRAMSDLQSAMQDRNISVSTVPEKGRSPFATRDFYPGEVIISQEPYVCVIVFQTTPQSPPSKGAMDVSLQTVMSLAGARVAILHTIVEPHVRFEL